MRESERIFQGYRQLMTPDYYGHVTDMPIRESMAQRRRRIRINLNNASFAVPYEEHGTPGHFLADIPFEPVDHEPEDAVYDQARHIAAALVNLTDKRNVVLCRNTTEALSLTIWLAGLMRTQRKRVVGASNCENPSTIRVIDFLGDHSNPHKDRNELTSFDRDHQKPGYDIPQIHATGIKKCFFNARQQSIETMKEEIETIIRNENPALLIMSHVLRHNGRLLPVKELTAHARECHARYHPDDDPIAICIDGAQALGNLDEVDIQDIGCDFYVACAHKALSSRPLGFLYMNPQSEHIWRNVGKLNGIDPQLLIIPKHMFHERKRVDSNVSASIPRENVVSFNQTQEAFREKGYVRDGNNFSILAQKYLDLREHCLEQLALLAERTGVPISTPSIDRPTGFVQGFQIGRDIAVPEEDMALEFLLPEAYANAGIETESLGRTIAKRLEKRGVALTFLRRDNLLRVSFSPQTSERDIDTFIRILEEVIDIPTARLMRHQQLSRGEFGALLKPRQEGLQSYGKGSIS